MKRFACALLVLAVCCTARSQDMTRGVIILLNSGVSFPVRPAEFTDFWNPGLNLGFGMGYTFSPIFSFLGEFDYNNFTFDGEEFLKSTGVTGSGYSITGGSATALSLTANVKATAPLQGVGLKPYLIAGAGLFNLSTADAIVTQGGQSVVNEGESETALSVLVGGGVDIPVGNRIEIVVQLEYVIGFTNNNSTGHVPAMAGVLLRL